MRRVIVLRPEPGASATIERARRLGLEAVAVPLFEIEPVAWEAPDPARFDALLLTSANAVRNGGDQLKALCDLPVHAVGEATAKAAREAGFEVATIGDAGIDRLAASLAPGLRLLHLAGEEHVAAAEARQAVTVIAVYRAREIANPDLAFVKDDVALVHSARAGRRFAELAGDRSSIAIAAISKGAADAAGSGWTAVEVAGAPDDDALLALAARLCNNSAGT